MCIVDYFRRSLSPECNNFLQEWVLYPRLSKQLHGVWGMLVAEVFRPRQLALGQAGDGEAASLSLSVDEQD